MVLCLKRPLYLFYMFYLVTKQCQRHFSVLWEESLRDYKVVWVWFTITSNSCTTDVVASSIQWAKIKCSCVKTSINIKRERNKIQRLHPTSDLYFLFFLRNVLHNMSQIRTVENKNCLGVSTEQWLDTGCTADPPTLEGKTCWSQTSSRVSFRSGQIVSGPLHLHLLSNALSERDAATASYRGLLHQRKLMAVYGL